MKKLLGLTVAALLIMGMVGGGTWAYFSDPETSTGNSLSAGTLNLKIGEMDSEADINVVIFNEASDDDTGPGHSNTTSFTTLKNAGTMTAELDIVAGVVGITDAEATGDTDIDIAGDDLNLVMLIAPWIDVDRSGGWNTGDITLKSDGSTVAYAAATSVGPATGGSLYTIEKTEAGWTPNAYVGRPVTVTGKGTRVVVSNTATVITVASNFTSAVVADDVVNVESGPIYDEIEEYENTTWVSSGAGIENMDSGARDDFYVYWVIPRAATNSIQGDETTIDFTFTLTQPEED